MRAKPPIFRPQDQYTQKTRYVFKINHVSGQLPRPRQRPWFSFAFFSCIKTRPLPGQGSFSRYIFKINHVPGQLPRPRQRTWFSFAFFSCIKTRKEGRGKGAKPPIFISQDQYIRKMWSVFGLLDRYIRKMNRVFIIHRIWISKTWRVFGLYDRYNLKNWRVLRIRHHRDDVRWGVCNTPLHWISKNQRVFW